MGLASIDNFLVILEFQSSHSARSGTCKSLLHSQILCPFQSSHSARSGTCSFQHFAAIDSISILPLREEWDVSQYTKPSPASHFNPPTPRGVGLWQTLRNTIRQNFNPPTPRGVGLHNCVKIVQILAFQSSHSARSGTQHSMALYRPLLISILPLREEWDRVKISTIPGYIISILPLREEWDFAKAERCWELYISILPLREEWDPIYSLMVWLLFYFNPPTPRGVGHDPA